MDKDVYPPPELGKKVGWVGRLGGKKKSRRTLRGCRLAEQTRTLYFLSRPLAWLPRTIVRQEGNNSIVVLVAFSRVLSYRLKKWWAGRGYLCVAVCII